MLRSFFRCLFSVVSLSLSVVFGQPFWYFLGTIHVNIAQSVLLLLFFALLCFVFLFRPPIFCLENEPFYLRSPKSDFEKKVVSPGHWDLIKWLQFWRIVVFISKFCAIFAKPYIYIYKKFKTRSSFRGHFGYVLELTLKLRRVAFCWKKTYLDEF